MNGDYTRLSAMDDAAGSSVGALESSAGLRRASITKNDGKQGTHFTDVPTVVLGSILSHLEDPVDVMSTLSTCRLCWSLGRTEPFRLRLRPRQFDETPAANCEDALQNSGRVTPQTAGSWTRAALGAIRKHMCATRELHLAGLSIVDDDVAAILTNLRCLDRLILDNCQKLTSAVADVLAASVKSGPLSISLQRCFGLNSTSTGNLLVASAADGSRLRTILLSHLDSLDIPRDDVSVSHPQDNDSDRELTRSDSDLAKCLGSISSGSGLRILALNNCAGPSVADFTAVAMLFPHLEMLLLGGSVQAQGLSRIEAVSQDVISLTTSALVRIIELLPRLRVLELTFFTSAIVQAVREQDKKKIHIWDFCEESSVAAAAWVLDSLKKVKPGSAINDLLRRVASCRVEANGPPGRETTPVLFSKSIRAQFWQDGLTLSDCLSTGSFAYTNFNVGGKQFKFPQNDDIWDSSTEDVALGLRGAANCSDVRKRTPLHMAAARGDVPMIAGLLAIGAVAVGMKDSSGGTALFVAAESGFAQACELLLQGGADVLASNRAGETPLYIAALRGHSAAVGIMLAHCHERGVNWQDADVYGDGWTPLMAAAVADRRNVGEMLLWAARYELGLGAIQQEQPLNDLDSATISAEACKSEDSNEKSEMPAYAGKAKDLNAVSALNRLPKLLNRQNRYGQTALHIAAQKGSVWFIEKLLSAGASLDVPNAYGARAADVAKRYKHTDVLDILRAWESKQQKEAPALGGKKSARKARRNKGKVFRVDILDQEFPKPALDCSDVN